MHVLILVTDIELCLNILNNDFRGPEGSSVIDKQLNDKMVKFTRSKFPITNIFSTRVGEGGPKVTFNIDRCYDIDNGLELYGNDNDHILFVSGGVDIKGLESLGSICDSIIKNPDALAIGNIHYSKRRWFRIRQSLVYINIGNWKKANQPWFGSWENYTYISENHNSQLPIHEKILDDLAMFTIDRNLPVVDRSYDSDQILRINNTGKREDIKMTIRRAPGWNFIDVAYKNNLEIGSWSYEIVKKWPWLFNEEAGTFQAKKLWIREDNDNS